MIINENHNASYSLLWGKKKSRPMPPINSHPMLPYFLDWDARVLLVSSELLAGVVFEGAFYSRAQSIPFSLSVTKFFSKHKKPWTISLHNHTILIHHKQNYFIQHTNVRFIY